MIKHERFPTVFEAIDYLKTELGFSASDATQYVRKNQYRMGTDRAVWMPLPSKG